MTVHCIGTLAEVRARAPFLLELEGRMIGVFLRAETLFAIEERCSHRAGPLSEGTLIDGRIVCPWHGSEFELDTGDVKKGPAKRCLKTHSIEIQGEQVLVRVNPEAPT